MSESIELPEWARRAQADAAAIRSDEPAAPAASPTSSARPAPLAPSGPRSREYVREILNALSPSRADAYRDWVTIGMCVHAENPAYLDEWEAWSRGSSKFKEGECARKWVSFGHKGGSAVSFGSVVYLARQDSGRPDLGKSARTEQRKNSLPQIPQGDHGEWVDKEFPTLLAQLVKREGLDRDREGLKLFQKVVEALDGAPVLTKARVQQAISSKETGLGLTKAEYNLAIKQARASIERERSEAMGSDYRPASVKFFGEGDATDWPQIARTFIAEFEGAIRFWKGEWFVWTRKLACYRPREEKNFKAMLVRWLTDKGVNVTVTAVNNLQMALLGPCELDSAIERPNWIWSECTEQMALDPEGKYLAFSNGIYNVLRPDDEGLPHDLRFWSHVCLPFAFDPAAVCPEFLKALEEWHPPFELVDEEDTKAWQLLAQCPRHSRRVQLTPGAPIIEPSEAFNDWIEKAPDPPPPECPEMQPGVRFFSIETQHIIQEFAGYLYEPLNPHNVFMLNYGPGGDGKSQLTEIYTALVGVENTSGLGLEAFDPKLTHALMDLPGKLLNVTGDTAEMDKVAEGQIKAITGGDRINIQRKYLSPLNEIIGTKFVMNCNTLPPFRDRTEGIWRRMILIQWDSVPMSRRIPALAKKLIGKEISGIFNWALAGFHRQRHHGFSKGVVLRSAISRGKTLVHKEINFFDEEVGVDLQGIERAGGSLTEVHKDDMIRAYKSWCERNNQKKGLYGDNMIGELRKWLLRTWPSSMEKLEKRKKDGGLGGLLQRATSGDRAYTRLVGVYLKRKDEGEPSLM